MEMHIRQFSPDKILKHLDRVNAWLEGKNPPPVTVELDMTNVCNHCCPQCSSWHLQNRNPCSLSLDLASNIIRQLAEIGVRGLTFTGGGEPLCHPHIEKFVKLAYKLGLDVGFITNGSLLNKETAKVLLECCTWLRISLDAASAKTFRKVHGMDGDMFNKVIDNIALLTNMKKRLESKTTIGVGYLTCHHTKNEMRNIAILSKKLKVDYLQFRPLRIHNKGKFKYHLAGIVDRIYECLNESTDTYNVLYSKHLYEMIKSQNYRRNYKKCYGQQFSSVISADAKVYLCCNARGRNKYCLGDLRKDSFENIWNSEERKKIIENIDLKDCVPICRNDGINQILWDIKQPREHVNFL